MVCINHYIHNAIFQTNQKSIFNYLIFETFINTLIILRLKYSTRYSTRYLSSLLNKDMSASDRHIHIKQEIVSSIKNLI